MSILTIVKLLVRPGSGELLGLWPPKGRASYGAFTGGWRINAIFIEFWNFLPRGWAVSVCS